MRDARAALVADPQLQGAAFGRALAALLDGAISELLSGLAPSFPVAVVALGSYGRAELCPGSDVDVLLLHGSLRRGRGRDEVRALAETLWYPMWDSGFVTGHAARSVKQSIALADDDLDALTALLEARHVVGDDTLTQELVERARQLARRRRDRVLRALADAADARRTSPGPVAEMLEPDLKEGAGGLRDLQALEWAGWALGDPGGLAVLGAHGFLTDGDLARMSSGRARLLETRVALHRVTGSRSDRLALQEQDAVAAALGVTDADTLVRDLATSAREIAWIAREAWARLRSSVAGPSGRVAHHDRPLADGVVLRDGRVVLVEGSTPTTLRVLEAAAAAAELGVPFERSSLVQLQEMAPPTWDVWERAAFLRLLRAGVDAIPVLEALDHEGALVRLLPEWEHVRSRPQRNAYHRFTVDRHLLEAVGESARLLDLADAPERSFDGLVARACRRPELLLLGALLHDIGKGMPTDHSVAGAETALDVARRIGLDSEGREILVWLVRNHLLMADVATRRDLSDAAVVDGLAAACAGDGERLRLLYLLTIGDSLATGPAAWGTGKAALVRELFTKTAAAVERGAAASVAVERRQALVALVGDDDASELLDVMPDSYVLAFDPATMASHQERLRARTLHVECEFLAGDLVEVTVTAPDRTGLLATVAGGLTVCGLAVREALLFSTTDGMALDVFRATDPFGRIVERGVGAVEETLRAALEGTLDVDARVHERRRSTRGLAAARGDVSVEIDLDASDSATVVEVHADDEVGLLYRIAATFADLGLDVTVAKVATLGARVVDVFYVRDRDRKKLTDAGELDRLRATLVERLTDGEIGATD